METMQLSKEILDVIAAIGYSSLYSLVCVLFGMGLLSLLQVGSFRYKYKTLSMAGYWGGAFFVGQGFLGSLWQLIATFGFFSNNVIITVLTMTGFSGIFFVPSLIKLSFIHFLSLIKNTWNLGFIWVILALLLIYLIAIFAYLTLSPPGVDPISFYLAQSKIIAVTHKIQPLVGYEALAQVGLNAEMHAAVVFALAGDIVGEYAAIMNVWVTALASAMILWALSKQLGLGLRGQWIVMIMLYTTSNFTNVLWDGKTDLFGAGLGLAAIYWMLQIGKWPDWLVFLLSGLMAGFAISSKISLITVMIPLLSIFALWTIWNDNHEASN